MIRWLVWLSDSQDGCPVYWFDWMTARMAVQFACLIEWQLGWLSMLLVWLSDSQDGWFLDWLEIQYFKDPRFLEALRSNNMRWDRQIWTLRSNNRLCESPKWKLGSKICTWNIGKWVLKSKKWLLRAASRPKWLQKIFWNILGSFRHGFISNTHHFQQEIWK